MVQIATAAAALILTTFVSSTVPQDSPPKNPQEMMAVRGTTGVQPSPGSLLSQRAGLAVTDVTIAEALTQLSRTSRVGVAFQPNIRRFSERVDCDCDSLTLAKALDRILHGTGFGYAEVYDQILVTKQSNARSLESFKFSRPQLASAPGTSRVAEYRRVVRATGLSAALRAAGTLTGEVVEAQSRQPLAGVQVSVDGTGIGSLTNVSGRFLLPSVPAGTHTLTVQRIGYATVSREVTVTTNETTLANFELRRRVIDLDEVVVTGTAGGTQRRAVGHAVGRLGIETIESAPSVRIEQVLGNRVPGVRIVAPPSMAGGASTIRIRGSSSLALSGDPIIFVDGVRWNITDAFRTVGSAASRMQDLDPTTIESIEIIKGPAAATLYGTEASNGVIQIITKRGAAGEPRFDASVEGGVHWVPDPSGMAGLQYYRDPSTGEVYSWNLYELEKQPDRYGKDVLTYGPIQRYNLSVRGGTDLARYFAALNHSDTKGVTRFDRDQRSRASVSISLIPRDNLSFHLSAARTVGETTGGDAAGQFFCRLACYAGPPAVLPDGSIPNEGRGWHQLQPPEARRFATRDNFLSHRTSWSLEATHTPTPWFTHRLQGGVDDAAMQRVFFTPKDPDGWGRFVGAAGAVGARSITDIRTPTRTLDYAATLSLPLTGSLTSATSFGLQYYSTEETVLSAQGDDFAVGALSTVGAAANRVGGEDFIENTTVGVYVQKQFGWEDRRFLTAAVRFDDNSAFGAEFDAAIYPKLSATWVVSEEGFWRDFLNLTELRVRAAWGEAGQQPSVFAGQTLYSPDAGPGGQPIILHSTLGNPELGPERGSELELGFDASFFGGRVELEFTRYDRITKDAIVQTPVRASVGFPGTRWLNVAQTSNWGTETQLNAHVWTRDPVRWAVGLGLTTMGSRIDNLGGLGEVPAATVAGAARGQAHVEGFPIAGIFARRVVSADFVSGNSGPVTNIMCDGGTGLGGRDRGGAPVPCEDAPMVFLGQVDPSWLVNLNSSWNLFRNWDLSATLDLAAGHHVNADYVAGMNTRFTRPLVLQDDPVFMGNQIYSRHAGVVHRGGFAKLRELTLRYTFPDAIVQRFGLARASITGTAFNVATLWREAETTPDGRRIFDSEMVEPRSDYPGAPRGGAPPMSHATVRVNVSF